MPQYKKYKNKAIISTDVLSSLDFIKLFVSLNGHDYCGECSFCKTAGFNTNLLILPKQSKGEQLEELIELTRILSLATNKERLVVIVGSRSLVWQNKVLKLFEEPPAKTTILWAIGEELETVVGTLLSRSVLVTSKRPSMYFPDEEYFTIIGQLNALDVFGKIRALDERVVNDDTFDLIELVRSLLFLELVSGNGLATNIRDLSRAGRVGFVSGLVPYFITKGK